MLQCKMPKYYLMHAKCCRGFIWHRRKSKENQILFTVIKRTGILLYRGNLNKGKIYTRRINNTDRKSVLSFI